VTTSQRTSSLFKPKGDERISVGTLGYFQARNRNRLYETIIREFQNSGISQATLARRLGKRPDVVCRWLGSPGNWTLDTVSDLLFAISGGEPEYSIAYPLDRPSRNYTDPEWLSEYAPLKQLPTASEQKIPLLPREISPPSKSALERLITSGDVLA
jgi:hypothetical protein